MHNRSKFVSLESSQQLTNVFLQLFCEKNSDGTLNLRLRGKDMLQRIGKRLNDDDMCLISEFLWNNPKVVKLDLCYNDIGDEGIDVLVKRYLSDEENTLECLNLVGCNIRGSAMKFLYSTVGTLRLKTLRLTGNKLGEKGGQFAGLLLGASTTLQHLDVGDTDQTLGSLMYFTNAIGKDIGVNRTLRVIDLSRIIPSSYMYQYDSSHLAESLGEMLKVNSTLIELHVQKNEFDGHDMELLLVGLNRNKTILLLDLGYNRIGDHGIELLANWLKTTPPLLGLNIAANHIGDTGARALSFGMPYSKIRLIDISYNKIEDIGFIDILNSIKKPYMLRMFYFWGNNLTPKTFKVVERMLMSGVLEQNHLDIRLHTVDGILKAAFLPTDHYKQRYYCVMDFGCPVELRIKRNKIESEFAQPRALVKFEFYDRFPEVDESLPSNTAPC